MPATGVADRLIDAGERVRWELAAIVERSGAVELTAITIACVGFTIVALRLPHRDPT